jgi:hypothetical protein
MTMLITCTGCNFITTFSHCTELIIDEQIFTIRNRSVQETMPINVDNIKQHSSVTNFDLLTPKTQNARKQYEKKSIRQSHLVMFSNSYDPVPYMCCVVLCCRNFLYQMKCSQNTVLDLHCVCVCAHMCIHTYFRFSWQQV